MATRIDIWPYKLAEPEKALLDWVYLHLQEGIEPATDELSRDHLNRQKLFDYANKYPGSVLRFLLTALAGVQYRAAEPPHSSQERA